MVSEKKFFFKKFPIIIGLWELYVTMAARVPIKSSQKPYAAFLPTWRCFTGNVIWIDLLTLEIYFFENVNWWRQPYLYLT